MFRKYADRIAYYDACDGYYVKHDLSAMEKFLAGYVNSQLDDYLRIVNG